MNYIYVPLNSSRGFLNALGTTLRKPSVVDKEKLLFLLFINFRCIMERLRPIMKRRSLSHGEAFHWGGGKKQRVYF